MNSNLHVGGMVEINALGNRRIKSLTVDTWIN
jgi:hypothetical protein